jgi:hypothetical protein
MILSSLAKFYNLLLISFTIIFLFSRKLCHSKFLSVIDFTTQLVFQNITSTVR